MTRLPVVAMTLLAVVFAGAAEAVPAGFVLNDDAGGPTCPYYSTAGHFKWKQRGGDWLDAAGALHGGRAFDQQSVSLGSLDATVSWDVTAMARLWQEAPARNAGVMVRSLDDAAARSGPALIASFHSRETAEHSPTLEVRWEDGRKTTLKPAADSFLDCTSGRSLGARPDLKVSAKQIAWLRFDLPSSSSKIQAAKLTLVLDKFYGRASMNAGVFRAAPAFVLPYEIHPKGIASGYVADAGIQSHPDVVFAEGFENASWARHWSELSPKSNVEIVRSEPSLKFEPLFGHALRVPIKEGTKHGLNLRYKFMDKKGAEPEEQYFRYYLRFADNWNPSLDGGKLPGFAGTYNRAGWGGRKGDGYNGWSARGSFERRPQDVAAMRDVTALGTGPAHADPPSEYWGWGDGPSGLLENNRWYSIEQYVKLNTPGEKDGVFKVWLDGALVFSKSDIRFRRTDELKIEEVWMNVYHGGTQVAPQDLTLYIDNVVIARRYIGPARYR